MSKRAKAAIFAAILAVGGVAGTAGLPPGFFNQPGVIAVQADGGPEATIRLAVDALIKPWEGKKNVAYQDIVGVWTICYGETKGVKAGMRFTDAQCLAMLEKRVREDFYIPLTRCIAGFDQKPLAWRAVAVSAAYNLGVPTICSPNTTATRLAREGRMQESCDAFKRFNRAGGKVVRGLVLRRENGDELRIGENELCTTGLTL